MIPSEHFTRLMVAQFCRLGSIRRRYGAQGCDSRLPRIDERKPAEEVEHLSLGDDHGLSVAEWTRRRRSLDAP